MLQVQYIRENQEHIIRGLAKRNLDARELISKALQCDDKRKAIQLQLDNNLAEQNRIAKQIGELFRSGDRDGAESLKARTGELKESSKVLELELAAMEQEVYNILVTIPNVPNEKVRAGTSADDNEVVSQHGEIPRLHDGAVPHWELAARYDIIDFELGNKITGAGFPVYKGKGARLQRALINFFLDEALRQGYTEIQPPHLVNEASGFGTGQLPDKEGQMYFVNEDNLYLIPTAEVPITNLYRDVILKESDFPVKNTGYTPCFRREAGSYGAHVRGLNRLHQFDKVEIVQVVHPDKSYEVLESMQTYVQSILQKLELPYRVLRLCGGDMGFTSAMTYDMEVFSSAQEKWLEVSSVSNFESFQANRLKLRFKNEQGKTQLCHTLNGSALALPRIVASLLENHQTPEGVRIPEALRAYTGFDILN